MLRGQAKSLSFSGFMRVGLDQQRGYCRDELGRRERLTESQTVGDAFRRPIGRGVTADVDHGQVWDEFSRAAGNLPAVRSSAQIDIGDQSNNPRRIGFEFAQRLSALRHVADIEPGLYEAFFQIVSDERLVPPPAKASLWASSADFLSEPSTREYLIQCNNPNSPKGRLVRPANVGSATVRFRCAGGDFWRPVPLVCAWMYMT